MRCWRSSARLGTTAIGAELGNRTRVEVPRRRIRRPARCVQTAPDAHGSARFCYRHSRGRLGRIRTPTRYCAAAAQERLQLWSGGDAGLPRSCRRHRASRPGCALQLTEEIKDLDERDHAAASTTPIPTGILASAPGVAADHRRSDSRAARRPEPVHLARRRPGLHRPRPDAWTLPVPSGRHGGPDQTLATRSSGRHCSWPPARPGASTPPSPPNTTGSCDRGRQTPQLRHLPHRHHTADPDHRLLASRTALPTTRRQTGTPVTADQARTITAEHYTIPNNLRARRRTTTANIRTDRRNKKSPSAPSTGPSTTDATTTDAALTALDRVIKVIHGETYVKQER